jgi:hypothetical protein
VLASSKKDSLRDRAWKFIGIQSKKADDRKFINSSTLFYLNGALGEVQ